MTDSSQTAAPPPRASIRQQLDRFLVRCPIRLCSHKEEDKTVADYGFIVDDLRPNEIRSLFELLDRLTGYKGNVVVENEEGNQELRFRLESIGSFMYFGLEILPHPTLGHEKLQGTMPEEGELAQAWNSPNHVFIKHSHTERVRDL